jgi:peptide/nickel transport system permease protein
LGAVVIIGISVITFVLTRVVPSDPAALYVGPHPTKEQLEMVREKLGLNQPLYIQYFYYMKNLFLGDLGTSLYTHRPVLFDISRRLPASLELIITALLISLIIGVPLGVLSAQKKDRPIDHVSRLISVAGVSVPAFFLGILFQLLFFRQLGWLPLNSRVDAYVTVYHPIQEITGFYLIDTLITGNWPALQNSLLHIILPAFALAAYPTGLFVRMTRSTMLEVLGEDYIRSAKASGLPKRTVYYVYALKNALGPTLTEAGLCLAYMLTSTFFVEVIFSWPGLGTYTAQSILSNDYPAIMGVTLVITLFYVFINLFIDLLQAIIDPRIVLK